MPHLSVTSPQVRRQQPPWRRRARRRWARRDDHLSADAMFALLPSLPRATLSRLADRIIERMDEIDGDDDIEDDRK